MSNSLEDLNTRIARLKKLRTEEAHQKDVLDGIKAQKDELQDEIMQQLKEAGAMSYKSGFGTLSINRRQTVKITDSTKVDFWLRMNDYDVRDYTKLDVVRVKPLLENAILNDGEVIEGVERDITEYLSLREATTSKETK